MAPTGSRAGGCGLFKAARTADPWFEYELYAKDGLMSDTEMEKDKLDQLHM